MTNPRRSVCRYLPSLPTFGMAAVAIAFSTGTAAAAGAGPGGVDLLHVPISWCPVIGSPAQANPNLAGDTQTDAILWRRHERPTDNIYINTAGITFRSAINNAWTVLDFPAIADPNTTLATPGDVRGEDVNMFGAEYNALIAACDAAYSAPPLNRANVGITAVNVGLFHDAGGNYVTTIGWGGCSQPMGNHTVCGAPHDGRIAVIDNIYLHPASPDRRWPGTNTVFTVTDRVDQLTGHELGHALGLDHFNNTSLLMDPTQRDTNGDGEADNIAFAAGQVNVARGSSMLVQGLEIDPPLEVNPGDFIADRLMDAKDNGKHLRYQDLASVKLSLDKRLGRLYVSNQLAGPHPQEGARPSVHWIIFDTKTDNGGSPKEAIALGMSEIPEIEGIDMVIRVDVRAPEAKAAAWIWDGREFVETPRVFAELQTLIMHPHFGQVQGMKPPEVGPVRLYDTVVASFPAKIAGVVKDRPLAIDVIVEADAERSDRLTVALSREMVLEDPSFPHCFVLENGKQGQTVETRVEGLLPGEPFHALVGPELVTKGVTDNRGISLFDLPIPSDARDGLHLVTIGTDDTALTADCAVRVGEVKDEAKQPTRLLPDLQFDILRENQKLMNKTLDLLRDIR